MIGEEEINSKYTMYAPKRRRLDQNIFVNTAEHSELSPLEEGIAKIRNCEEVCGVLNYIIEKICHSVLPVASTAVKFNLDMPPEKAMPPPPPNLRRALHLARARRICMTHSLRYEKLCGLVSVHAGRDALLYSLIDACGLTRHMRIVSPPSATAKHLESFHSCDYIKALKSPHEHSDAELQSFGLGDDAEVFPGLWDYCLAVSGASIQCASLLLRGEVDVAINWGGGRHHARKAQAGGFCYANDAVLAACHLIRAGRKQRILYIDIDVHHGDGVVEAFYCTNRVFTVSFHKFAPGFYPPSDFGGEDCIGEAKGTYFNLNIPIEDGCTDETFYELFSWTTKKAVETYTPEVIILQCGCDTLSKDSMGPMNLTSKGIAGCVGFVRALDIPLLLLGGGGYNAREVARCWTAATAAAIGPEVFTSLPASIPFHPHFDRYGPDFQLHTTKNNSQDMNHSFVRKQNNLVSFFENLQIRAQDINN